MITTFLTNKLFIPTLVILALFVGGFSVYEYGKSAQKQIQATQQQTTYVNTRTRIDAAINSHPNANATDALNRLRQRQGK